MSETQYYWLPAPRPSNVTTVMESGKPGLLPAPLQEEVGRGGSDGREHQMPIFFKKDYGPLWYLQPRSHGRRLKQMFSFLMAQGPELITIWRNSETPAVWSIQAHLHTQEKPGAIQSSCGFKHKGKAHPELRQWSRHSYACKSSCKRKTSWRRSPE